MNSQIRSEFAIFENHIFLDSAYMAPLPTVAVNAGTEFLHRRSRGTAGRLDDWLAKMEQVRDRLAELIHANPAEIAFTPNTTTGTNIVATSLHLAPEDNIVYDDLEFPSNKMVWLHQERTKGVENRVARSHAGAISLSDFEELVDDDTRILGVSHVAHRNGFVHDLESLASLAHSHGAYLVVDASQSVGAIQVNARSSGVDFLTCGAYKWLLGPMGLAFLYVREELLPTFEPVYQGWMQMKTWGDDSPISVSEQYQTARKLETATLHFQGLYEWEASLDYMDAIGMQRIECQVLRLSRRLHHGLAAMGLTLLTPADSRSGIVTCVVEDGPKASRALANQRIVATVRGNEVRISPHFFNTEDDIDLVLDALRSC